MAQDRQSARNIAAMRTMTRPTIANHQTPTLPMDVMA
jgi:hypothetical protein